MYMHIDAVSTQCILMLLIFSVFYTQMCRTVLSQTLVEDGFVCWHKHLFGKGLVLKCPNSYFNCKHLLQIDVCRFLALLSTTQNTHVTFSICDFHSVSCCRPKNSAVSIMSKFSLAHWTLCTFSTCIRRNTCGLCRSVFCWRVSGHKTRSTAVLSWVECN